VKSIKLKGDGYHMKLDKMITNALQASSLVNGTLSLEHQNQGKDLEKIQDVENRGEINLLSDEIHPHKVRHSKHNHNNEMNAHQTSRPLDEMQGDDPRHPYSAHNPKKMNRPRPLFTDWPNKTDRIRQQFLVKEGEFMKILKKIINENPTEINLLEPLLEQSRKLCKETRLGREDLKAFMAKRSQKMESLKKTLKKEGLENTIVAEEYLNPYLDELSDLKNERRKANNLLDNCRKLASSLESNVKYLRTINPSETTNAPTTMNAPTTERPTLSLQEESMTTRFRHISDSFNDVIQNINLSHERISKLQSHLNKNISHDDIKNTKQSIYCFEKIILPRLECELTNIKSTIINEKNYLEFFGKEGTISPSLVTKFTNEYNNLIDQIEQPIHYSNNRRNKRDLSAKPRLSEKLANIATDNKEKISVIKREPTIAR
jgi:hypothetical protein